MASLLPQTVPGKALQTGSTCHGVARMPARKSARTNALSARVRASRFHPNLSGLAQFLRTLHPRNTADLVAADLKKFDPNFSSGTVRNWLDGRNTLSLTNTMYLIDVYGPDVMIALWPVDPPAWMDDQAIAKEEAELAARSAEIAERRAALEARR